MSLAQRVRDIRYAKGWGPDELANRAEISRTALYQIESGKTGLAAGRHAATDRGGSRSSDGGLAGIRGRAAPTCRQQSTGRGLRTDLADLYDWVPAEGGPLSLPRSVRDQDHVGQSRSDEESRFAVEPITPSKTNGHESIYLREGELMSKLHDLLHSPIGNGVVRILEELHGTASAVAFFDLIDRFGTRSRFIG